MSSSIYSVTLTTPDSIPSSDMVKVDLNLTEVGGVYNTLVGFPTLAISPNENIYPPINSTNGFYISDPSSTTPTLDFTQACYSMSSTIFVNKGSLPVPICILASGGAGGGGGSTNTSSPQYPNSGSGGNGSYVVEILLNLIVSPSSPLAYTFYYNLFCDGTAGEINQSGSCTSPSSIYISNGSSAFTLSIPDNIEYLDNMAGVVGVGDYPGGVGANTNMANIIKLQSSIIDPNGQILAYSYDTVVDGSTSTTTLYNTYTYLNVRDRTVSNSLSTYKINIPKATAGDGLSICTPVFPETNGCYACIAPGGSPGTYGDNTRSNQCFSGFSSMVGYPLVTSGYSNMYYHMSKSSGFGSYIDYTYNLINSNTSNTSTNSVGDSTNLISGFGCGGNGGGSYILGKYNTDNMYTGGSPQTLDMISVSFSGNSTYIDVTLPNNTSSNQK